jgi:hypothetical protein
MVRYRLSMTRSLRIEYPGFLIMKESAAHLGVHYSMVSRAVKKVSGGASLQDLNLPRNLWIQRLLTALFLPSIREHISNTY